MPSGEEQGRYRTPVASKHLANKENTLAKQDEVDPEGSSPPPLVAPLSDDTLDASAEKEAANNQPQQQRSGINDIDSSPFAATPSPIGNRTLSNSEDPGNDETIDGTFDNDTGVGISRTLNISEIDETSFLNSNTATNGESSVSSRRNSTSNDTTNNTLKSILELSEIDTTFDGAALNRTIGATDASTSASGSLSAPAHRAARDLSEIDITMDRTAGDTANTGNANSIEESKLQAELAADASERMQRLLEEATTGGSSAGGDENSTLAGQAFVGGGGSGASVMTSSGSMASYSIGGNTVATAGTDIAEFLRKQNEAMQRALADAGAGVGGGGGALGGSTKLSGEEETIISPTKTRAVDAAVENAKIMAEATAKLTPTQNDGKPTDDNQPSSPAVRRSSSMEFGSQSHLNVGATGKFTTDDTTGAVSVTVQSVKTSVSNDSAKASKSTSKSVRTTKTAVSSSSTYQSQYALSPSQRAKESMTVAEKIQQAEAEAMARDGGPRFEKMSVVSETDDDYVPILDYSSSAKKKKAPAAVGSIDYNDYSPDTMMASPEGSAVQRYRIMMRRKKRRRQRRIIRAGLVVLIVAAILVWWHRGSSGEESVNGEDGVMYLDNSLEEDHSRSLVEEDDEVQPPTHRDDDAAIDVERLSNDIVEGEDMEEVIEADVADALFIDDTLPSEDVVMDDDKGKEESSSLASAFAREKIQLVNTDRAPIVKLFKAAKTRIFSVEPRAIPFSHFWNEGVRNKAKSEPILAGINELLDSMLQ